jgi:hypothetical protein
MPFFKNDRRFLRPPNTVPSFFISFSFSRSESIVSNAPSHNRRTPAGKPHRPPAVVALVAATPPGSELPLLLHR